MECEPLGHFKLLSILVIFYPETKQKVYYVASYWHPQPECQRVPCHTKHARHAIGRSNFPRQRVGRVPPSFHSHQILRAAAGY